MRVVLAEDVDDIRYLIKLNLELDGRFQIVGEASNGVEAIDRVEEQRPDVVVLDLDMPALTGGAAISAIRECSPETKIVVFSGYARVSSYRSEAGSADQLVEKNLDFDDLVVALESYF